ncbi:alpha-tocopherol transfer protein-like [Teleopsis dalmanni]|uniref:alpha-tocopherol transfer protein-like n=1 Tax=Teleopsis dalmanni TaxID=139649 RepID=UPI0018CDBCCE|nr:alpha-tocopherol transfer protein-like [Teleopsis dalmanni]
MSNIRALPEHLQKAAIDELNEVPDRIPADIEALKTWIKQEPHLNIRTDDQFLLAFLRGCKYSLEKAKSKIDKFYTLRTKYPDLFQCYDVDNPRFREILNLGVMCYVPKLTPDGKAIFIMRTGVCSPDDYTFEEIFRTAQNMAQITLMENDNANIKGVIGISEFSNATAAHFVHITPSLMKKLAVFSEEAMPLRQKAGHFLHMPSFFSSIFNVIKPMLSEKQQNRMFIHGKNLDTFYASVPKECLPKELGGDSYSIDEVTAYWNKKMDEYRDFFKQELTYGTNESLRRGKPIDFDSLFGMEGSFRKLNVD